MTEKELLYIEDAMNHLKFLKTKCENAAKETEDPSLQKTLENMAKKHEQTYQSFYNLI